MGNVTYIYVIVLYSHLGLLCSTTCKMYDYDFKHYIVLIDKAYVS